MDVQVTAYAPSDREAVLALAGRLTTGVAPGGARGRGHTRLTLEPGAGSGDARRFYERLGYVTEEVVLTRDLTVPPGA